MLEGFYGRPMFATHVLIDSISIEPSYSQHCPVSCRGFSEADAQLQKTIESLQEQAGSFLRGKVLLRQKSLTGPYLRHIAYSRWSSQDIGTSWAFKNYNAACVDFS